MERNLIAPRVDVVFRVLFGRERNKDILVDLLNAAIKKAYEELEKLSQDPEMRMHYELRLKGLTDYLSDVHSSYEEGEKLGMEKGEKLGMEKGEKLGMEKGRINVLQSLAKKRFPHTSEGTIQLIEELNGESLEELAEAILDVADGRAFRHLLLQLKQKSTPEHPLADGHK